MTREELKNFLEDREEFKNFLFEKFKNYVGIYGLQFNMSTHCNSIPIFLEFKIAFFKRTYFVKGYVGIAPHKKNIYLEVDYYDDPEYGFIEVSNEIFDACREVKKT